MNHDRFPAPGQQEYIEPPQYAPDPHNPAEADIAAYYEQPLTTPGEPMGEIPQVQDHGQLTGLMPERPQQQEAPQYALPAEIAAFHAQHAADNRWQQPPQPNRSQEGDYLIAPPTREAITPITVDPGRMGFRGLVGRLRNRVGR